LDFLGDLSTRFPLLLSLPGTPTLLCLYTVVTDSLPTSFLTPRKSSFRFAKQRASNRSSGSANFYPLLRSEFSLSPYLQRVPVDTENPKLQSKESFTGTAVKLWLPQSQTIKAFIAYSWQAMDRDSMLVLRSTGMQ
jgi:hypothetical protein